MLVRDRYLRTTPWACSPHRLLRHHYSALCPHDCLRHHGQHQDAPLFQTISSSPECSGSSSLASVFYTITDPPIQRTEIKLPVIEGYWKNLIGELCSSILLLLPSSFGRHLRCGPIKFDVTEAAAVAVVYALFVQLAIHGEMWKKLPR